MIAFIGLLLKNIPKPLLYVAIGAALVAAFVFAWNWHGNSRYAEGVAHEKLASAAAARAIDVQYRKIEQAKQAEWDETYARLSKANGAALAAAASSDTANLSLLDTIDAERTRAAEAARAAGRSERAVTAAWDVLQECRAEYSALAKEAERVLGIAWTLQGWSKVVAPKPTR